eukprot:3446792-Rhodomonas_salina.2
MGRGLGAPSSPRGCVVGTTTSRAAACARGHAGGLCEAAGSLDPCGGFSTRSPPSPSTTAEGTRAGWTATSQSNRRGHHPTKIYPRGAATCQTPGWGSVRRGSAIGLSRCDGKAGGLPRPTPRCAPIAALTQSGGAEDQPWQRQVVRCWGDSASGPWHGGAAPDPTLSV